MVAGPSLWMYFCEGTLVKACAVSWHRRNCRIHHHHHACSCFILFTLCWLLCEFISWSYLGYRWLCRTCDWYPYIIVITQWKQWNLIWRMSLCIDSETDLYVKSANNYCVCYNCTALFPSEILSTWLWSNKNPEATTSEEQKLWDPTDGTVQHEVGWICLLIFSLKKF